jgi:hypothetical protein
MDGDFLVVANGPTAALIGKRDGGETVSPRVGLGEGEVLKLVRSKILRDAAFGAFHHIDAVDALAVGGISVACGEPV